MDREKLEKQSETSMTLQWPEGDETSIRSPHGLKTAIDEILVAIKELRGVTFSRNQFIINAIRHYLNFLRDSPNIVRIMKKIEDRND